MGLPEPNVILSREGNSKQAPLVPLTQGGSVPSSWVPGSTHIKIPSLCHVAQHQKSPALAVDLPKNVFPLERRNFLPMRPVMVEGTEQN